MYICPASVSCSTIPGLWPWDWSSGSLFVSSCTDNNIVCSHFRFILRSTPLENRSGWCWELQALTSNLRLFNLRDFCLKPRTQNWLSVPHLCSVFFSFAEKLSDTTHKIYLPLLSMHVKWWYVHMDERYNKNLIPFICCFKQWSFTQHLQGEAADQGCSLWFAAEKPFEVLQPKRWRASWIVNGGAPYLPSDCSSFHIPD